MIKINLLPVRAAKKKETAVQQLVIMGISVLVVVALVGGAYLYKRNEIKSTKQEIDAANAKINELKNKIGKLEEIKTLKEQVKKKLDVLNQLRKNKSGPAQRLSTLSDITPDQLWLTNYDEKGDAVSIKGYASTEELISKFMVNINSSADYTAAELIVSEQKDQGGTKLKYFELSCKLKSSAPPQPAPPAPEKK